MAKQTEAWQRQAGHMLWKCHNCPSNLAPDDLASWLRGCQAPPDDEDKSYGAEAYDEMEREQDCDQDGALMWSIYGGHGRRAKSTW